AQEGGQGREAQVFPALRLWQEGEVPCHL
ncbi:hypothetical protein BN1708_018961, partial [Verticillium longisporum]